MASVSLYSMPEVHAKEAVDLKKVRESIVKVIDDDAEKRGDGTRYVVFSPSN